MKLAYWQMKQRMGLPLEVKINLSIARIREWYESHDGMVYVAFSGGLDSTVLLDLVRRCYPHVPAVFNDTGLEYPEIREFVRTKENVEWLRPKKSFKQVVEQYGYPIISKEQAQYVRQLRHSNSERLRHTRLKGNKHGKGKISTCWLFLVHAPFDISEQCCEWLKKKPAAQYCKRTGRVPYIGIIAAEGYMRTTNYLKNGCNAYHLKTPTSTPLAFWTKQDIWDYIHTRELPYSRIYDMGYERTGCMFCMFGLQSEKEPNKFQRMAVTHPKLYDYCINDLGCGRVLEYIGVDYKPALLLPLEVA